MNYIFVFCHLPVYTALGVMGLCVVGAFSYGFRSKSDSKIGMWKTIAIYGLWHQYPNLISLGLVGEVLSSTDHAYR
jgi:hypothetical protein